MVGTTVVPKVTTAPMITERQRKRRRVVRKRYGTSTGARLDPDIFSVQSTRTELVTRKVVEERKLEPKRIIEILGKEVKRTRRTLGTTLEAAVETTTTTTRTTTTTAPMESKSSIGTTMNVIKQRQSLEFAKNKKMPPSQMTSTIDQHTGTMQRRMDVRNTLLVPLGRNVGSWFKRNVKKIRREPRHRGLFYRAALKNHSSPSSTTSIITTKPLVPDSTTKTTMLPTMVSEMVTGSTSSVPATKLGPTPLEFSGVSSKSTGILTGTTLEPGVIDALENGTVDHQTLETSTMPITDSTTDTLDPLILGTTLEPLAIKVDPVTNVASTSEEPEVTTELKKSTLLETSTVPITDSATVTFEPIPTTENHSTDVTSSTMEAEAIDALENSTADHQTLEISTLPSTDSTTDSLDRLILGTTLEPKDEVIPVTITFVGSTNEETTTAQTNPSAVNNGKKLFFSPRLKRMHRNFLFKLSR